MPDFLLLLSGGEERLQDFSPQELQVHINQYFAWIEELAAAGHYLAGWLISALAATSTRT